MAFNNYMHQILLWRLTSHGLYYKIPYNPPLLFEVVVACPLLVEIGFDLGKKSTENSLVFNLDYYSSRFRWRLNFDRFIIYCWAFFCLRLVFLSTDDFTEKNEGNTRHLLNKYRKRKSKNITNTKFFCENVM